MPFDVNWIQTERQTEKQNIRLCIINIIPLNSKNRKFVNGT